MLREEAKEYGILPDNLFDATIFQSKVEDILGVSADQVEVQHVASRVKLERKN